MEFEEEDVVSSGGVTVRSDFRMSTKTTLKRLSSTPLLAWGTSFSFCCSPNRRLGHVFEQTNKQTNRQTDRQTDRQIIADECHQQQQTTATSMDSEGFIQLVSDLDSKVSSSRSSTNFIWLMESIKLMNQHTFTHRWCHLQLSICYVSL